VSESKKKGAVQYPPILGDVPIGFDPQWEQKYKAWVERRRKYLEQQVAETREKIKSLGESVDWDWVEEQIRSIANEYEEQNRRVYAELRRLMDTAVRQGRLRPLKRGEIEEYLRKAEDRVGQEMLEAHRKRKEKEAEEIKRQLAEYQRQQAEYQRMQLTRNFFEGAKQIYRYLSQNMNPFREANRFVAERTLQMIPPQIRYPIAEFQKELRRYPALREAESALKRMLGIE